ncbi:MAG: uracil permease, partial [Clostridium argentinense]|nr:uracil permease [Clostridium argentinense]
MSQNVITKSNVKSEGNKSVLKSAQRLVLAFQHLIAMFGATVLVPILTGFDPSIALIAAGCGTLIFHLCTKGKVPVFLGSSFAFIPVIQVIASKYGDLRYAQGGIFFAGLAYVLISFGIK